MAPINIKNTIKLLYASRRADIRYVGM